MEKLNQQNIDFNKPESVKIEDLNLKNKTIQSFKIRLHIFTLKDLLCTPYNIIFTMFDRIYTPYDSNIEKVHIRNLVESLGYHLYGENEDMTEINLNTRIELLGLPNPLIKLLKRHMPHIKTLNDITSMDYDKLNKIPFMSINNLNFLLKYLHSLGLSLKNEPKERFVSEEETCSLTSLNIPDNILRLLNRYNIYTLTELLNSRNDICNFPGFGPKRLEQLNNTLSSIGISISKESATTKIENLKRLREDIIKNGMVEKVAESTELERSKRSI